MRVFKIQYYCGKIIFVHDSLAGRFTAPRKRSTDILSPVGQDNLKHKGNTVFIVSGVHREVMVLHERKLQSIQPTEYHETTINCCRLPALRFSKEK